MDHFPETGSPSKKDVVVSRKMVASRPSPKASCKPWMTVAQVATPSLGRSGGDKER